MIHFRTFSQNEHTGTFQSENMCRQQFMSLRGKKKLCEKEKMLVTSIVQGIFGSEVEHWPCNCKVRSSISVKRVSSLGFSLAYITALVLV